MLALVLALAAQAVPAPRPEPIVIKLHVCPATQDTRECQERRREAMRVKEEVDLRALLLEDLLNQNTGYLDISLRARITAAAKRLARNDY